MERRFIEVHEFRTGKIHCISVDSILCFYSTTISTRIDFKYGASAMEIQRGINVKETYEEIRELIY